MNLFKLTNKNTGIYIYIFIYGEIEGMNEQYK